MMTMNQRLDIHEQAAAWVSRLLSGKVSAAEKRANASWRAEDPAQDTAQAELEAMLVELDQVGERVLADQMVQELNAAVEDKRRSRRMFAGVTSIAATFVAAVALSVSMWSPAPDAQFYETGVGERRTVQLEDGSTVQLNTDSRLRAEFADGVRQVSLERGEAFFDVAHNKERPFVVNAGKTDVTVLGTKFNVRLGASSNLVSVLSGLVAVSQHTRDGQAEELARLTQGQQIEHMPSANDAVVTDFDEASVFAWRTGKALYEKTPLFEVVADLNRYFKVPLEIADDEIANLPVTGTFNLNDQNVVVDALESAFSLMAIKRIDGVILLYASHNE